MFSFASRIILTYRVQRCTTLGAYLCVIRVLSATLAAINHNNSLPNSRLLSRRFKTCGRKKNVHGAAQIWIVVSEHLKWKNLYFKSRKKQGKLWVLVGGYSPQSSPSRVNSWSSRHAPPQANFWLQVQVRSLGSLGFLLLPHRREHLMLNRSLDI